MKIQFDDSSYIEIINSNDKITIIISAKDRTNPLHRITNAVEISNDEFKRLISDVKM